MNEGPLRMSEEPSASSPRHSTIINLSLLLPLSPHREEARKLRQGEAGGADGPGVHGAGREHLSQQRQTVDLEQLQFTQVRLLFVTPLRTR